MSYRDLYARLDPLPPDRYPTMQRIYGALDEATLQANILSGLEVILAGIEAWVAGMR
jgi:hypothetical protein